MLLLKALSLFLDSGRADDAHKFDDSAAKARFPSGQLTSSPWAGWWHEEA